MKLATGEEEAIARSADMLLVQLYIPREIAREVVSLLGKLGLLMFKDMNSRVTAFQRAYISELRKFQDMEQLILYMQEVVEAHSEAMWRYLPHKLYQDANDAAENDQAEDLLASAEAYGTDDIEHMGLRRRQVAQVASALNIHSSDEITDMLQEITSSESRVRQLHSSLLELRARYNHLLERRYVGSQCSQFFANDNVNTSQRTRNNRRGHGSIQLSPDDDFDIDLDELSGVDQASDSISFDLDDGVATGDASATMTLNQYNDELQFLEQGLHGKHMVTGSISRDKVEILNRILWRLLRGNLFFQNFPIQEPLIDSANNNKVQKDCFIVFTHGDNLIAKVKRVVESLNGMVLPLSELSHATMESLNLQLEDLQQIINSTELTLHTELLVVNDTLPIWNAVVKREKSVFATMNLFRQESKGFVAEGWIPATELNYLTNSLNDHTESIGSELNTLVNVIHTNKSPPTYHKTNKFTQGFQTIVDAYGIATYKEINPGLATVVTFPFMFAIMFGDVGHGFILFLIGFYLVWNERKLGLTKKDEILEMAFSGRYVILLMGGFSIYTGLLYNDIFSKSMTLFTSGWQWPSTFKNGEAVVAEKIGVYPFGLDYAWHGTDNNLIFTNSYKMKLSILMGFIHMTYSYMFSYVNYKNRNSRVDIIGNFIPGLIFMQSIFGYLSWAIVFKWSKDWIKDDKPAPGLLNMLINMFLSPGTVEEKLYPGQSVLQVILLLAALVCVPWLLLYKPLKLRREQMKVAYSAVEADQELDFELNDGHESLTENTRSTQALEEELETNREFPNDNDEVGYDVSDDVDSNEEGFNFGDIMIHQVIHTIEFCLNCISHTASYLRLWALSLAHAQLSSVLWTMTIQNSFTTKDSGSPLAVAKVVFLFGMWFVLTVCILVVMEGTSAMLHALRLHWVEAMSKFFEGEGYAYEPFTFKDLGE